MCQPVTLASACFVQVNNAGILRMVALAEEADWVTRQSEIDINCSGPGELVMRSACYTLM